MALIKKPREIESTVGESQAKARDDNYSHDCAEPYLPLDRRFHARIPKREGVLKVEHC
jgi:hypothetical protein